MRLQSGANTTFLGAGSLTKNSSLWVLGFSGFLGVLVFCGIRVVGLMGLGL